MPLVDSKKIFWTEHAKIKSRQYRLSVSRVKRILRHPKRLEIGVAPRTTAAMQPAGSPKHPYEIWVMWSLDKVYSERSRGARDKTSAKKKFNFGSQQTTIISVWKYPGISSVREPPPIPEDVWEMVDPVRSSTMLDVLPR